jgi:hypothetical protein
LTIMAAEQQTMNFYMNVLAGVGDLVSATAPQLPLSAPDPVRPAGIRPALPALTGASARQ